MKCPLKKYEPGDILLFKNIPCDHILPEDIKNAGAIKLMTGFDEPPSVEIITGSCDEELCAWWVEEAQKCAILVTAESQRKAAKQ